ncbi:nitrite reductase small subunit NirD [Peristeroidobacter agariperforans]|uniref:nitrite reductase small subunit NirD n=1 Tax=Peristeroidobacter agariperforans TaxID=268404 RepID=UPI00101CCA42|nr:nitrite reductase small subunit NirD [Peristeroidobacter agariperforans]
MKHTHTWSSACSFDDLLPDSGVAALIDGRQIAIFRVGDAIYALDNYDPHSEANVLSRGLVGDLNGEPVVASPVYKHHFNLATGRCVEDADYSVRAWPTRVTDGKIWIKSQPLRKTSRRKLVVIGNGMAGMKVVEELLGISGQPYDVTVFGAEPVPNYNRILLSPMLAGEKRFDDIVLNPIEWYRDNGVTLHLGDPAVAIDRIRRRVRSQNGTEAEYDRLLIATGSNPIILPVPGKDLPGVVTFRDLQDVNTMLEAARTHKKAVVIGGGLLGLEAANALLKQGMQVTVVHLLETLMERQLDPVAAQLLKQSLEKRGLRFHMPAKTTAILGTDRVRGVQFADETIIETDLVVMAAGIRPNTDLARAAGLRCDRGVLVNDTMQTFDPCVYAVGECVQHRNNTYGLVAPLYEQASVCATHLSEHGVGRYRGSMLSTHLKVTGIDLFSAGDFLGGPGSEALVLRDAKRGIYKRIVLEDNKVRGAVLYGDTRDGAWYCELMNEGRDVGALRDKLIFGEAVARRQ